jgi:hypothetical protein
MLPSYRLYRSTTMTSTAILLARVSCWTVDIPASLRYSSACTNYQQHPQSDVMVRPPPILISCYKHMPITYIWWGSGAGSGPRSAVKTIGNCFSNWKTHFHISKFLTRIRSRGLIVFSLVHFLRATEATKIWCAKHDCLAKMWPSNRLELPMIGLWSRKSSYLFSFSRVPEKCY